MIINRETLTKDIREIHEFDFLRLLNDINDRPFEFRILDNNGVRMFVGGHFEKLSYHDDVIRISFESDELLWNTKVKTEKSYEFPVESNFDYELTFEDRSTILISDYRTTRHQRHFKTGIIDMGDFIHIKFKYNNKIYDGTAVVTDFVYYKFELYLTWSDGTYKFCDIWSNDADDFEIELLHKAEYPKEEV